MPYNNQNLMANYQYYQNLGYYTPGYNYSSFPGNQATNQAEPSSSQTKPNYYNNDSTSKYSKHTKERNDDYTSSKNHHHGHGDSQLTGWAYRNRRNGVIRTYITNEDNDLFEEHAKQMKKKNGIKNIKYSI